MSNWDKRPGTIGGIPTIGPVSNNWDDESIYGLNGCIWRANDKGDYKACVWSYKTANKLLGRDSRHPRKYVFGEEAVIRFSEDRLPEFIAALRIRRWTSEQIALAKSFNTNYLNCD